MLPAAVNRIPSVLLVFTYLPTKGSRFGDGGKWLSDCIGGWQGYWRITRSRLAVSGSGERARSTIILMLLLDSQAHVARALRVGSLITRLNCITTVRLLDMLFTSISRQAYRRLKGCLDANPQLDEWVAGFA